MSDNIDPKKRGDPETNTKHQRTHNEDANKETQDKHRGAPNEPLSKSTVYDCQSNNSRLGIVGRFS